LTYSIVDISHDEEQSIEEPAYQSKPPDNLISTSFLMELICERDNLNLAYKRVYQNKGIAGFDKITVSQLPEWIKKNKEEFIGSLLDGTYRPRPVKGIYISKPKGRGARCIGVLSVIDRLVQNAIFQIISDSIDSTFSDNSYGFRKNRGALNAIQQTRKYILDGYKYVADIDIEKFFDNIHHDKVMYKLSMFVRDKRVLAIVRRFLQAGMWRYDLYIEKEKGIYQGGSLSPLLSNLLLHDIDVLLEKRGHVFCRYADDIKIFTRSLKAAERVLLSTSKYLSRNLRLKCNEKKTKACPVQFSEFLGYKMDDNALLTATQENIDHLKYKVKKLTKRSRFIDVKVMIMELNQVIVGWTSYFRFDYRQETYREIDTLLRRRIRANIFRRAIVLRSKGLAWIRSIGCRNCNIDFAKTLWSYNLSIGRANYVIPNSWFLSNNLRSVLQCKEKYRQSEIIFGSSEQSSS
jgi:group II intron reverse transcriptase/maturase